MEVYVDIALAPSGSEFPPPYAGVIWTIEITPVCSNGNWILIVHYKRQNSSDNNLNILAHPVNLVI